MRLRLISIIASFVAAFMAMAETVSAAVVTYTDESTFQAALTGSFTLANLDAAPFATGPVPASDANFLSLGIDVLTPTEILSKPSPSDPETRARPLARERHR